MFNRRLFLIPAWLVAQFAWNLFSGSSLRSAFEEMTSLNSIWASLVVIVAIVLYARGYQVAFGKDDAKTTAQTPKKSY